MVVQLTLQDREAEVLLETVQPQVTRGAEPLTVAFIKLYRAFTQQASPQIVADAVHATYAAVNVP